ncbi:hypothetical protein D1BOALGB6SA_5746 [Olavius sp. associated proteobacterium Delta 1]|nr:hypothetical protein D1BOALGB6SA_5746 [Olavius sp. associated proteobacterium Delta 1]
MGGENSHMQSPQHPSGYVLDRAQRVNPSIFDILRFCGSLFS